MAHSSTPTTHEDLEVQIKERALQAAQADVDLEDLLDLDARVKQKLQRPESKPLTDRFDEIISSVEGLRGEVGGIRSDLDGFKVRLETVERAQRPSRTRQPAAPADGGDPDGGSRGGQPAPTPAAPASPPTSGGRPRIRIRGRGSDAPAVPAQS